MRNLTRTLLGSLVAGVLGIVIGIVGAATAHAGVGDTPATQGFCGNCQTHTLLGASSHDFHSSCNYSSGFKAAPNMECHQGERAGTCSEYHYACGDGEPETDDAPEYTAEAVAQLVRDGVAAQLGELVTRYGTRVTFNASRRAVQLVDCDGHVSLHLPVTAEVAEALATVN